MPYFCGTNLQLMKNPVLNVAAIHDLSGVGRVSLTAVIPILSGMGIHVTPLPTAVLSAHTQYPDFQLVDLTEHMRPFIAHWKQLKIHFDAIYSGFLASPEQIDIVAGFIDDFRRKDTLVVVDPVLGDNGKMYSSLPAEMVGKMQELITHADVITPNITEAALLLNKPLTDQINGKWLREWVLELSAKGPGIVIVTSVPETEDRKVTSVVAYNRHTNRFWKVSCDYLPANYPGTGDSFTSVLVGSLLQGDSLPIALDRAVQFISMGVRTTFGHTYDPREGIILERIMKSLDAPSQISSYELLDE